MLKLPVDFLNKYQALLGAEKAKELFTSLEYSPKKAYRINSLKWQNQVSYKQDEPILNINAAFYGKITGLDPEWVSGTVYSQDPAAMFPAMIAEAKPGERVLDLCAAPGGKSTALGEQLQSQGLLLANEISRSRAKILRENIERWGISNALITNETPQKLASQLPHFFDKIVVDAPCSGEGMFRKNNEAINYWSPDYISVCQKRQKDILTEAVKMLRPGGELIYSTCTFAPEENEQIISWLVTNFNFEILPIKLAKIAVDHGHPEWADGNLSLKNTLRFWPFDELGEGQFVAKLKLVKSESQLVKSSQKKRRKRGTNQNLLNLNKEQILLIKKVLEPFNLPNELKNWSKLGLVQNNHVCIPAFPEVASLHLKIINNGIDLGILKKKRFEPSHQLAMVLGQIKQNQVINLSEQDYLCYLHGETVRIDTEIRGFVLISCHNLIFSFGKVSGDGILKNFYPKGLRTVKKGLQND
ncbi:NOL1/NOP2/sun family putative RNA methylase [Lactobacillus bombicola]|uniref:NOL1/NOP2/sun family putative RNA methylase n=1 Tax=Lactobacillus bombicola TaxID=1505723 RepID=A0A1I1R4V9_9LACO|nr:RsmF rRNA methyltransferase first C-terminal domain-containing protein [Lactobacillus bombicola]SFD29376.1 NOL1/NOP2/sun family putative RNA methylase [Lactobacillus bombicola]